LEKVDGIVTQFWQTVVNSNEIPTE